MSKSRGSARRGLPIVVVVAMAAIVGAVVLGSVGTASAGNLIVCGGKVQPTSKKKPADDGTYSVQCSEDIRGFSVISNQQVDFFGSETGVVPTVTESATLQCEGTVPGFGFGCGIVDRSKPANKVSAGSTTSGSISFDKSPCDAKGSLKVWVVATSEPLVTSVNTATNPPKPDSSTTGEYSSQPFSLSTKGWSKKACSKSSKGGSKQ